MNLSNNTILSLQDLYYVTYTSVTRRELYEYHYKVIRIISGSAVLSGNDKTIQVSRGEYLFINQGGFSRITMYPDKDKPFQLICLNFSDRFLQKYREQNLSPMVSESSLSSFEPIQESILLNALYSSLSLYAENEVMPDQRILTIKLEECLHILELENYAIFCQLLSNQVAVKVNLREFMETNYVYNAPLERFARFSGRSLSSFRREFMNTFEESPNKWLIRKRLERGYDKIVSENCRPIDIYWELGFETLAHFSRKFKEHYNITPSDLRKMHKDS